MEIFLSLFIGILIGIKIQPRIRRVYGRLKFGNPDSTISAAEQIRRNHEIFKSKSESDIGDWYYDTYGCERKSKDDDDGGIITLTKDPSTGGFL